MLLMKWDMKTVLFCLSHNHGTASRQLETKPVLVFKEEKSQLYAQLNLNGNFMLACMMPILQKLHYK